MRAIKYLASALAMTLFAGCSLQPLYTRPDAPVSTTFPMGDAYRTNANAGDKNMLAASDTGWRDFLPDPRLQRLVELGLKNNRDLRVAALNVGKVQAQYRIQQAALLPQVDLGVSASSSKAPTNAGSNGNSVSHKYSMDLSASWELDFFGRLSSLSDAALQQYLASKHARQAAQILLVSQIADQYLATIALDEQMAVTKSTLQTAESAYQLVKLQFDTGVVSELDLRLSQTVVEQAKSNYATQVRLSAQAKNALVLLVGQALPDDLPAATHLDNQLILADIPEGMPSQLLQRRPDILQAEAILQSENANIGAARAAFFPKISLTGSLGSASTALGGLFSAGSSAWSFAPTLLAPIFNAGSNKANLDIATIQKDIAIAQYEKAIQIAFREVSDGLAARGTYDEQLAAQQKYTAAQQRRLELAQALYSSGTDSYLGVLTAQTDFYNAQQALITARLNRLTSLVDLYRALGGGWFEHNGDAAKLALTNASKPSDAKAVLQQ